MGHSSAFVGYVAMNGPRGDERLIAPNMIMLMADRNVGQRTLWQLSGRFSTDAATVGGQGYPLLFQTGERCVRRVLGTASVSGMTKRCSSARRHVGAAPRAVARWRPPECGKEAGEPAYVAGHRKSNAEIEQMKAKLEASDD
jgi:hypothetical protein